MNQIWTVNGQLWLQLTRLSRWDSPASTLVWRENILHDYDKNICLELRQNDTHRSCWDYVEVRNGDSAFSDQMGVFCGDSAPGDVFSSASRLWIKFFTDSDISAAGEKWSVWSLLSVREWLWNIFSGFSAVFTAEDPVCGSLAPLNVTNSTQVKLTRFFEGMNYWFIQLWVMKEVGLIEKILK